MLGATIVDDRWDFGDGTLLHGAELTHTYSRPGIYALTLRVIDDTGASDTETQTIVVNPGSGPGLTLNWPAFVPLGQTLTAAYDPQLPVDHVQWDFYVADASRWSRGRFHPRGAGGSGAIGEFSHQDGRHDARAKWAIAGNLSGLR